MCHLRVHCANHYRSKPTKVLRVQPIPKGTDCSDNPACSTSNVVRPLIFGSRPSSQTSLLSFSDVFSRSKMENWREIYEEKRLTVMSCVDGGTVQTTNIFISLPETLEDNIHIALYCLICILPGVLGKSEECLVFL